jgi:MFS family permease
VRALLVALGIDNVGSGLFLPLTLVYATRVVGLPLAVAGVTVTVGTVVGLGVPPVAGRFVDRVGPRPVVIASQVVQAAGAGAYFVADGVAGVAVAVCLLAAGQQLFYSALFALVTDVAGERGLDRPFAVVGMVRSACFGLGALVAAALLTSGGLRVAVLVNAASFLGCALLLALRVRAPRVPRAAGAPVPLSRRFLALIGLTGLVALGLDFFLVGIPVYVLGLGSPPWLPGVILALHTAVTSTCGVLAVRVTRGWPRTTTLALGAWLVVAWCGSCLAAAVVPAGWRPVWLLGAAVVLAASGLFFGARVNALAVALAPVAARGRYLAAFQYAFTVPGVLAPAVVALFAAGVWLPWVVVAVCATTAAIALPRLGRRLPAEALTG